MAVYESDNIFASSSFKLIKLITEFSNENRKVTVGSKAHDGI
jgi:hypothetical protein